MREKLILVTNAAQLRPGTLCKMINCVDCSGSHRFMILNGPHEGFDCESDDEPPVPAWEIVPVLHRPDFTLMAWEPGDLFIIDTGVKTIVTENSKELSNG